MNAWVAREVEGLKNQASRRGDSASVEDLEKQLRDGLKVGDYLPVVPVVDAMMVGRDGSIWIRPSWSDTDWTVYPPTGTKTFIVRVPAGVRTLFDVSMQRFWTETSDTAGRPIATRYRFSEP